ncbi:Alpha/Beta hydrolase protein [Pelagophyceae sp. CCMP2097]|nr:Alpha/Beta hydrolase protein [Pelagophyceae sp. CCMP2097]
MPALKLSTRVSGNVAFGRTMVFVSGFPDDHDAWAALAPHFQNDYKVVTLTMPGFSDSADEPKVPTLGFDFDAIVDMMHAALEDCAKEPTFTLVGHDWGAVVCMLYMRKYPNRVSKYVALDTGAIKAKEITLKEGLVLASYQAMLAVAFLLHAARLGVFGRMLISAYPWRAIGPVPHEKMLPKGPSDFFAGRGHFRGGATAVCYPYFQFFLCGGLRGKLRPPAPPTLFIYGKRKRAMFHGDAFLRHLEGRTDGSAWHALDGGHWFFNELPGETAGFIKAFL